MRPPLTVCILLAFAYLHAAAQQEPDTRPNIILLLADDLRPDALGCAGAPFSPSITPNIDALSARGITFDQAFATTAICVTSRCNILTGRYAASSGWRHGNFRGSQLTEEQFQQTYLGQLRQHGYQIGYVGKWHVGKPPSRWFNYDASFEGQGKFLDSEGNHLTHKLGQQAVEMIRNHNRNRPFFLCVGFKAPHVQDGRKPPFYPYDEARTGYLLQNESAPEFPLSDAAFFDNHPDFLKRSLNRERWGYRLSTQALRDDAWQGYHRLVAGVDAAVGEIISALEETQQTDNTIVLFTSDHGVYLGSRGFAGKWLPHEPSIRIPLIITDFRVPDSEAEHQFGLRSDLIALTVDIAPTILEYAEINLPSQIQGHSLVSLANGQNPDPENGEWRTEFFYDHYYNPTRIPATEAIRTTRWKYIRYMHSDPLVEELYDLQNDPLESRNLAHTEEFLHIRDEMEQTWQRLRQELRAPAYSVTCSTSSTEIEAGASPAVSTTSVSPTGDSRRCTAPAETCRNHAAAPLPSYRSPSKSGNRPIRSNATAASFTTYRFGSSSSTATSPFTTPSDGSRS